MNRNPANEALSDLLSPCICPPDGETLVATETGFVLTFPYFHNNHGGQDPTRKWMEEWREGLRVHFQDAFYKWATTWTQPVPSFSFSHREADDALLVTITY